MDVAELNLLFQFLGYDQWVYLPVYNRGITMSQNDELSSATSAFSYTAQRKISSANT